MIDMASYYLEQLRKVQPEGPYYLGGMCAGGTIAFEMALQLEEQGQEVGLVALIDSADAKAPRKVAQVSQHRLRRFFETVKGKALPEASADAPVQTAPPSASAATESEANPRMGGTRRASLDGREARVPSPLSEAKTNQSASPTSRLESVVRKVTNVVQYESVKLGQSALNELRFRRLQRALDKQQSIPGWVTDLTVRAVYERLERAYSPRGTLRGQVVLYRATWADAPDQPLTEVFRDPQLGWDKRVANGNLALCDVPGGHSSMLQEPQVEQMAEDLAARVSAREQRAATGAQTADRHPESSRCPAPDRAHEEPPAQV
jgi:thioesterase domain-containing protein